jgi:hypothetical protein
MTEKDKIVNFYDKLGIKGAALPKTWKKTHMFNKCHTLCLGGTGSGKSNALINYISRSSGEFYKIIVCSFSTTDEPLYNMLEETGKIELINDIDEVPDLEEFDNKDKNKPKLIVFDDFLNVEKKKMKKIHKYLISSRKFGFSVWLMSQDYTSVPKVLVRNINYFILFKINDNISLNNIIRNHNIADVDSSIIKSACSLCTQNFGEFFMIDMKTGDMGERFRHNFLDFLDLNNPQLL